MILKSRWLLFLLSVCLLTACLTLCYPYLRTQFFIHRALKYWQQEDYSEAERWAYQAHRSQPDNVKALGMLGDSLHRRSSPAAIFYKKQVAESLGKIDDAWLDLARTALDLGYTQAAADALTRLQDQSRSDYQNLKGAVFVQQNRIEDALLHFGAAQSASGSQLAQYNWAAIALITPEGNLNQAALQTLLKLQKSETFGLAATRAIAHGYVQTGQLQESKPELYLLLQQRTTTDQYFALPRLLEAGAAPLHILEQSDTPQIRLFISAWLRDRGELISALEILIPALDSAHLGVMFSYAELLDQTGETTRALAILNDHTGIIPDLLRWKFRSTASNQLPVLASLRPYLKRRADMQIAIQMLTRWQSTEALIDVYAELITQPGNQGARDYLDAIDFLLEQDLLLSAYQLSQRRYEVTGSSISGNNFAYLALVLKLNTENTADIAATLFEKYPDVAQIKTTYLLYQLQKKEPLNTPADTTFIREAFIQKTPRFSQEKDFIKNVIQHLEHAERSL